MNKICSTCRKKNKTMFEKMRKDCSLCRTQWRAFYAGQTDVSPMMRAITVEQHKTVKKANKKALKKSK